MNFGISIFNNLKSDKYHFYFLITDFRVHSIITYSLPIYQTERLIFVFTTGSLIANSHSKFSMCRPMPCQKMKTTQLLQKLPKLHRLLVYHGKWVGHHKPFDSVSKMFHCLQGKRCLLDGVGLMLGNTTKCMGLMLGILLSVTS